MIPRKMKINLSTARAAQRLNEIAARITRHSPLAAIKFKNPKAAVMTHNK